MTENFRLKEPLLLEGVFPGLKNPNPVSGLGWGTRIVAWRAGRIADPVGRLRYLRSSSRRAGRRRQWFAGLGVAVVAILALATLGSRGRAVVNTPALPVPQPGQAGEVTAVPAAAVPASAEVWLVERADGMEQYSNGLRVDAREVTRTRPRAWQTVDRKTLRHTGDSRLAPAGIVYHTTESHLAPFEQKLNRRLRKIGRATLDYVRARNSYHYFVDRFGRVFRTVDEGDVAYHAGHSVWADDEIVYLGLNDSFLGVSFETQTSAGDEETRISPAQRVAGRQLTEWLRSQYRIAPENCVTHAQVSVNPANMRIAAHTDWAGNFPFEEMGLPENYEAPPASVALFGFSYDPVFFGSTGARLWKGVLGAEDAVRDRARALNIPLADYKTGLRRQYKELAASLREERAGETEP